MNNNLKQKLIMILLIFTGFFVNSMKSFYPEEMVPRAEDVSYDPTGFAEQRPQLQRRSFSLEGAVPGALAAAALGALSYAYYNGYITRQQIYEVANWVRKYGSQAWEYIKNWASEFSKLNTNTERMDAVKNLFTQVNTGAPLAIGGLATAYGLYKSKKLRITAVALIALGIYVKLYGVPVTQKQYDQARLFVLSTYIKLNQSLSNTSLAKMLRVYVVPNVVKTGISLGILKSKVPTPNLEQETNALANALALAEQTPKIVAQALTPGLGDFSGRTVPTIAAESLPATNIEVTDALAQALSKISLGSFARPVTTLPGGSAERVPGSIAGLQIPTSPLQEALSASSELSAGQYLSPTLPGGSAERMAGSIAGLQIPPNPLQEALTAPSELGAGQYLSPTLPGGSAERMAGSIAGLQIPPSPLQEALSAPSQLGEFAREGQLPLTRADLVPSKIFEPSAIAPESAATGEGRILHEPGYGYEGAEPIEEGIKLPEFEPYAASEGVG